MDKTRATLAAVLLAATLATVPSGCRGSKTGGSKTYSEKQVKSAFESHGLRLIVGGSHFFKPALNSGVLFFTVSVLESEKGLRKYYPPARSGGRYRVTVPGQTFDFALRRRNVVVLSKGGLDSGQKQRITLAIESLH